VRPLPVALAATLHDPTGALRREIAWALPRLRALYAAITVATSPPTSRRLVADLRDAGIYCGTPSANIRGPLYRLAVREAARANAAAVHYLDFDRALHWLRVAPREYRAVVRVGLKHSALLIGRTEKAHASHHRPLWATEVVADRLMADHLAVRGRLDFLVPSFVLAPSYARELVRRSRARDDDVYGEWAALVPTLTTELAYIECRGLDWETPDRHRRAVRRTGLATWRRKQETPKEWALRTALAARIVGGFERTRRRAPGTPRLVRLRPRAVR
jgi:hypothetical protein